MFQSLFMISVGISEISVALLTTISVHR